MPVPTVGFFGVGIPAQMLDARSDKEAGGVLPDRPSDMCMIGAPMHMAPKRMTFKVSVPALEHESPCNAAMVARIRQGRSWRR
jgi:hypothetical protein